MAAHSPAQSVASFASEILALTWDHAVAELDMNDKDADSFAWACVDTFEGRAPAAPNFVHELVCTALAAIGYAVAA